MVIVDPEFHALIPPLTRDEYARLEENILAEGCRDALVVWDNVLLDGHNRYEICTRHGIEFDVYEIDLPDRDAAKVWMIDNQKGRRNLSDGWKYELAQTKRAILTKMGREKEAEAGKIGRAIQLGGLSVTDKPPAEPHDTRTDIAADLGWSTGKVAQADVVWSKAKDDEEAKAIKEQVMAGEITVNQAYTVTKKKEKAQHLEEKKHAYTQRVEEAKESRADTFVDIYSTQKKFRIIYADPPWNYDDKQNLSSLGGAGKHYYSMSIDELCAMPIKDIIAADAVLFLWVTSPMLYLFVKLMTAWGFEYKTSFVWDKVKHNMGHYNSVRHEFLLIGGKGKSAPDVQKLFDSVQVIERTDKHSEKPIAFMDIIDTLYVYGDRIELFAREAKKENWFNWGNEV
jgi:N6-adenosine-specific RNA methylase IME4